MQACTRWLSTALVLATVGLACGSAGAQEADWYPSRYGADDRIGAANLLTPERVVDAARLVETGEVYALGIELNESTPAFPPRRIDNYVVQPGQHAGLTFGPDKGTYNDDVVSGWLGIGTQIDGLGHLGIDNVYYNGLKAEDFVSITGLEELGIESVPPLVGRGVLLDIAAYKGVDIMNEGEVITVADIEGAAQEQGIEIREGDIVLLHTGWLGLLGEDDERFVSREPGIGVEAAQYLADSGAVAVGADNWAVEVVPFEEEGAFFPAHQTLLAKNGVYILENINTAELAADQAYEFLFVLGQARLTGAVQMIINPVAIR